MRGNCVNQRERGGVILLGLARKSGDHVRADGRVRKVLANQLRAPRVVLGAVPAMHRAKDPVRPGLQRHVKMPRHAGAAANSATRSSFTSWVRWTDAQPLERVSSSTRRTNVHSTPRAAKDRARNCPDRFRSAPLRVAPPQRTIFGFPRPHGPARGSGCARAPTGSRSRSNVCRSHPEFSARGACDRPGCLRAD